MITLTPELLFDGIVLRPDMAVVIDDGMISDVIPACQAGPSAQPMQGILAPGFVDLQVNGGAGLLVGADTDAAALGRICGAHRDLGCAAILPTLITDRPEVTTSVIQATIQAINAGTDGLLGLHLEGPHLDPRRAGAHDPALIRPMQDDDLAQLCQAARDMPVLMVTLAPESATADQIARLTQAGVLVSLGHSDCSLETARAGFAAGACLATHLFNAMSQMGHRQPGLAGAVLSGDVHAGLIADGVHVDPAALTVALRSRPDGLFLVSDCMAVAGSDMDEFTLHGRRILRRNGRLTLPDGTLAGADLRLDRAIRTVIAAGASPARALAMATSIPADFVKAGDRLGRIATGRKADLILLDADMTLQGPVVLPQGNTPRTSGS
ncbi:N-acetylglucosamine-6-phosphate deacetylase [Paracoccus sp. JM45]|uniref:N-acetylglucosamine-6-phosphate deacetylase n=1 Tax=Paracoccus sp. JM45 TaxID=2283626 RepID=UPI000E6C6F06|nr:N-acetylglucosamine-6-phosphate deacetylase [Paracoccus sp. JM45]RJE80851.1 N-acetylglucosamine-6-phosphate deacetylase [Paracoccus sp. JM45]